MTGNFTELRYTIDFTILDTASLSDAQQLVGVQLVALIIPDTWETATTISFQGSVDGTTFYDLYFDGAEYTETVLATGDQIFSLTTPEAFLGIPWVKVRSGTTGTPVAQADDDVITGIVRPI